MSNPVSLSSLFRYSFSISASILLFTNDSSALNILQSLVVSVVHSSYFITLRVFITFTMIDSTRIYLYRRIY